MNKREALKGLRKMAKECNRMVGLVEVLKRGGVYLIENNMGEDRLVRVKGFDLEKRGDDGDSVEGRSDDWFDMIVEYDLLVGGDDCGLWGSFMWLGDITKVKEVSVKELPLYVNWVGKTDLYLEILKGG